MGHHLHRQYHVFPITTERPAIVLCTIVLCPSYSSSHDFSALTRFLSTMTSYRQICAKHFKIRISRMRKSQYHFRKIPIGITWGKLTCPISQSSRHLETSYWCHFVQNLTDLSNDDVSKNIDRAPRAIESNMKIHIL